jgi:hypothetical protein
MMSSDHKSNAVRPVAAPQAHALNPNAKIFIPRSSNAASTSVSGKKRKPSSHTSTPKSKRAKVVDASPVSISNGASSSSSQTTERQPPRTTHIDGVFGKFVVLCSISFSFIMLFQSLLPLKFMYSKYSFGSSTTAGFIIEIRMHGDKIS